MEFKNLLIIAMALGCVAVTEGAYRPRSFGRAAVREVDSERINRQVNADQGPVAEGVRNNFIGILTRVANASETAGTNVSRAAAVLIRGTVREGFNLGSVATYLPRLLFLDGPNQFIETLRLIRSNQLRLPNDMDSAIDTLMTFAGSVRDSSIPGNFSPVLEFFPNMFTGIERFVQVLFHNVLAFLAPIPPAEVIDQTVQSIRTPITNKPINV